MNIFKQKANRKKPFFCLFFSFVNFFFLPFFHFHFKNTHIFVSEDLTKSSFKFAFLFLNFIMDGQYRHLIGYLFLQSEIFNENLFHASWSIMIKLKSIKCVFNLLMSGNTNKLSTHVPTDQTTKLSNHKQHYSFLINQWETLCFKPIS